MMWLKACPKCGGDLYAGWDLDGASVSCLQCGRSLSEAEADLVKTGLAARARRAVQERQRDLMRQERPGNLDVDQVVVTPD